MKPNEFEFKKSKEEIQRDRIQEAFQFKGFLFFAKLFFAIVAIGFAFVAVLFLSPVGPIGSALIKEFSSSPALCAIFAFPILMVVVVLYYVIKVTIVYAMNRLENEAENEDAERIARIKAVDGKYDGGVSGTINPKDGVYPDEDENTTTIRLSILDAFLAGAAAFFGWRIAKKFVDKIVK